MRDRQQLRLVAGEWTERDRLVEADIRNEPFQREVTRVENPCNDLR